ncbi:MAG: hypothetical protein ACRDQW_06735, partial [Haloechinothrix sp.]
MDERDLEELFRDVPGDAPAPTFSAGDVAACSTREAARRRMRIATAGAAAVLVLAGAGIVGILGPGLDDSGRSMVAGGQPEAPGSFSAPMQGGVDAQKAEPDATTGTPGCHQVHPELATALADELPATVATAAAPQPGDGPCAEGGGRAAYRVREGAAVGLVSVAFVPSGTRFQLILPEDAVHVEARTAGGGTLIAISNPDTGSAPPVADDLQRIADS